MWFELGGIRVPIESVLDFEQGYESIGGTALLRFMSGGAVLQTYWQKLRTTLSGAGWWPPGLDGLDYDAPLTLKCAAPRAIRAAVAAIALPAARRTDAGFVPIGHAVVPGASVGVSGGDLVPTAVSIAANLATLTPVTGAIGYQITYWPQLIVFATPPATQADLPGAAHRWSLTAEEV